MPNFPAPDHIRAIAPYIAGKPIAELAREYGLQEADIIKLASNENPLGIGPRAQQAMFKAVAELGRYPDSNGFALKAALSQKFSVPADWITLGNGSNDILELAARAFLAPGKQAIYAQYSFAVYPLATQGAGAQGIVVPARNFGHDLSAMLQAVTAQTNLIFIANPNNPTGTFIPAAEIETFLQQLPARVMVVLDEAYNEYLPPELRFDSVAWARRFPNLIVSRTFSKAYGLAGLRVGYAIAQPEVTDLMNRVRQPFNVNTLAQVAALAALEDQEFLQQTYTLNRGGLAVMTAAFEKLGLAYVPSHANFVLVKVGDAADAGMKVNQALLKRGIIVRPVGNYDLPQWLRVSVGLPEENAAFLRALPDALAETGLSRVNAVRNSA